MVLPGKIMFISVHGDPLAKLGSIQSGGQNIYVKELVRTLDSMGIQTDVFTHWSDASLPQMESLGRNSRVIRLTADCKGFHSKHQMFGMLPMFVRELRQHVGRPCQYTVIHTNYWLSGWVGMQLKKSLLIPRVHTSHSLGAVRKDALNTNGKEPLELRLRMEKELLQGADRVIATTPVEKNILTSFYSVPPENINVIPCGVNTELFHPVTIPLSRKEPDRNRKLILFVGRFEENKGLEILLKSFVILKKKHPLTTPGLRLVIAGGDRLEIPPDALSAQKKRCLQFIRENGISDLVEFAGPLKHEILPDYYSGADITVVPSFYESFGLVAVEAMACGCPVIASRTGGLQHNIIHGKTGLLVEPKNPEELASAIETLMTDAKTRKQMSVEAALHARQFSWQKIASNVIKIYSEVTRWQKMRPFMAQRVF